jgi:hypothetical protein
MDRKYFVYCRIKNLSANDFDAIGQAIKVAPELWIIKTLLAPESVVAACIKLADESTPIFVCEIGDSHGFSGRVYSVDEDSRIRKFVGLA